MAYTGTGTQEDPYVVTEWDDLISLITTTCYIELDADIDLSGVDINSVNVTVLAQIDGKGHTIKNGYKSSIGGLFHTRADNDVQRVWRNTNFKNWYISNGYFLHAATAGSSTWSHRNLWFDNCTITMELVAPGMLMYYVSENYTEYAFTITPKFINCNIYIKAVNTTIVDMNSSMTFFLQNSRLDIEGTLDTRSSSGTSPVLSFVTWNSYITGNISCNGKKVNFYSFANNDDYSHKLPNSIVDMIIDNAVVSAGATTITKNEQPLLICNADWTNVDTSGVTQYALLCSRAEMTDPEFLYNHGIYTTAVYADRYRTLKSVRFADDGAYILTGYTAESKRSGEVVFSYISLHAESWITGAYGSPNGWAIGTANGTSNRTGQGTTWYPGGTIVLGRMVKATWTANSSYYARNVEIPIGCVYYQGYHGFSDCHIYRYYLTDANNPLLDLVPVYDMVDEVYGFYNRIDGSFLGNVGAEGTAIRKGYDCDWIIANGKLINNDIPNEDLHMGAFADNPSLYRVIIPRSVKKIGRYAFANTALTSVTIADDCEYYPTSFPEGCVINTY